MAGLIEDLGCEMLSLGIGFAVGNVAGALVGAIAGFAACSVLDTTYLNDSKHHAAEALAIGGCLRVNHNNWWLLAPVVSFDHVGPDHSRCH